MSRIRRLTLSVSMCVLIILTLAPCALAEGRGQSQVPAGWTRIASGGLGNPSTMMMFPFKEFAGKIYSWVPGMGGDPGAPAAPVWTYDGQHFSKASADGFGDPTNTGITPGAVFEGKFYVGTSNRNGAQLWRTANGTQWERVGQAVFTEPGDGNCVPLGVQGGKLIVGFDNYSSGIKVWSFDGTTFARANTDGFGVRGGMLSTSTFFNGRIHVIIGRNGPSGEQLPLLALAYNGGTSWVATGAEGFGDPANVASHVIYSEGSYIYTGTDNVNGGQVWRYDGTAWTKIDIGGISKPANNLVLAFPWQGELYVSASFQDNNPPAGPAQVYHRQAEGAPFETVTADGFGDPANGLLFPGAVFQGQLLAGTFNMNGFQVWAKQVGPSITSLNPNGGALGSVLTINGHNFGQLPLASGRSAEGFFVSFARGARVGANNVISWSDTKIELNVPEAAEAGAVTVTNPTGTSNGVDFLVGLSNKFYFAEGSTRDNAADGVYDEWLCLMNPGTSSATVDITYMLAGGAPLLKTYSVPARSRVTVDVEADVGTGQDVSILAESDKPLVAERSMYFDYRSKWDGGDVVVGATGPAPNWYFAEGTTRSNQRDGSFEEWLCLMNPGEAPADTTITYTMDSQEAGGTAPPPIVVEVTIPPKSRMTRDVAQDVGIDKDVSASVSSDVPIVAERPMYFDYHGAWVGGDTVPGAINPASDFYFAEGCTYPWANEWLCLANPTARDAEVTVTYRISGGIEGTQSLRVPALSRETLNVADSAGSSKDVSLFVHSDHPLLAERSQYFDYGSSSWEGGAFATGSPQPRQTYYFAEGSTRSNSIDGQFEEWVSIENPNDNTVNVKMTFLKKDGVSIVQTVQVQPRTRGTVSVNAVLGEGVDASLVLEASEPVVAERPMYFDYRGFAKGGSVSRGYGL